MFFIGIFHTIDLIRTGTKFFIFSTDGIWIKNFGFIPWSGILELGDYPATKGKKLPRAFGIRFKDPQAISQQSDWQGKMRIFWSKVFGYPPLLLPNLDVSYDEIINFCEPYLDAEQLKRNETTYG